MSPAMNGVKRGTAQAITRDKWHFARNGSATYFGVGDEVAFAPAIWVRPIALAQSRHQQPGPFRHRSAQLPLSAANPNKIGYPTVGAVSVASPPTASGTGALVCPSG